MLRPAFQGLHAPTPNVLAGFDINIIYLQAGQGTGSTCSINTVPTAPEAAAFATAEATWERFITGYLDTPANNILDIDVCLEPIDGPGNVLGSAGPQTVKTGPEGNFLYTSRGRMTFDTADTASLAGAGILNDIIVHEMGHILGIGILWSSSAVGIPGFQELYINGSGEYTGAFGVAAYNLEFGQTGDSVPVELGDGSGTANSHWNEVDGGPGPTGIVSNITGQDLRDELMTGWLNGPTFISTLTVQSLRDLGYNGILAPVPSSWNIDGSGDWNDPNNWSTQTVPNGTDATAVLGTAITQGRTVFTDNAVVVNSLRLNNANTYAIAGRGNLTLDGGPPATVTVTQGTHELQVRMNLNANTTVDVASGATLQFNNRLNLNGQTLTKTGAGTLALQHDLIAAGGIIDVQEGTVSGGAVVAGGLHNGGGIVSPEESPGILQLQSYTQGDRGILLMEIGGRLEGSQHDVLVVEETLIAGGTLQVELLDGFTPAVGDSFDLLEFGEISGQFATLSLPSLAGNLRWDDSSLYTSTSSNLG